MSEKLKEALSAVIDGEADEFELRRVLDEIGKDSTLARSWERYHLIGAVMRGERTASTLSMRERVWAEVSVSQAPETVGHVAEPEGSVAVTDAGTRRWTPFAVAAAVAVAVVVGFLGVSELEEVDGASVADSNALVRAQEEAVNRAVLSLNSEVTPTDQTRTQAYIVRHLQQLGMDQSGIGFAKMVAYERD